MYISNRYNSNNQKDFADFNEFRLFYNAREIRGINEIFILPYSIRTFSTNPESKYLDKKKEEKTNELNI